MLSVFILSLHKGAASSDESKFQMSFESVVEMLEVLAHEFGDMIPLETGANALQSQAPGALVQLRQNSLIETRSDPSISDPLMWNFVMTSKGT